MSTVNRVSMECLDVSSHSQLKDESAMLDGNIICLFSNCVCFSLYFHSSFSHRMTMAVEWRETNKIRERRSIMEQILRIIEWESRRCRCNESHYLRTKLASILNVDGTRSQTQRIGNFGKQKVLRSQKAFTSSSSGRRVKTSRAAGRK